MKKNDREMTGVLYGGVKGFRVRKDIIITTILSCKRFGKLLEKWLEKMLRVT